MARVRSQILRDRNYAKVNAAYRKNAVRVIAATTDLVRNDVLRSLHEGGKSGRTYNKTNPRRTHIASAPGEAPATDTGFLAANVHKDIDQGGLVGTVESRAPYSSDLEFGTSKISPRPFMQPALEENRRKIRDLARKIL